MPPQVYEEVISLSSSVLEPVPLTRENAEAFPIVPLRATGAFQQKEFRVYGLENEYIRAEICPQLGGRLISLFDKRDQSWPIPRPEKLETVSGGPRGVLWPHGVEIDAAGRLNDLGPVDAFPREPDEEDQPAAVFLFDRLESVSWHACWSLEDRAELSLEIRAFNRSLHPVDFSVQLKGLGGLRVIEESAPVLLLPRRTSVFHFRLIPAAGFGIDAIWGRSGIAELRDGELRLRSTHRQNGARLVIVGSAGSVEAEADLNPEVELVADLPNIGQLERIDMMGVVLDRRAASIRMESRIEELWRHPAPGTREAVLHDAVEHLENHPLDPLLPIPTAVPGGEHVVLLLEAFQACRRGDYKAADNLLEQYLGLNAEDVLAWWLKSILRARIGREEEENAEAMNAHFLAPLEPVLRVQSFLAVGPQGRDPNPLMRPLAADEDASVDAVHELLLAGLVEEAHQVLDELLRHRPSARLHILAGWLFLRRSHMAFESARHAQAAAELTPEPPFPNHPFEFNALRDLMAAHPLSGLRAWAELESFRQ